MNDKKIIKYAAIAAGITDTTLWKPLEDIGDAMALAAKLCFQIAFYSDHVMVWDEAYTGYGESYSDHCEEGCDLIDCRLIAAMRAISRCAAEIGMEMSK